MTHADTIRHLTTFSETMIRDLKPDHARIYLRGCIPVWRESYGKDIAGHMAQIIKIKLDATGSNN